MDGTPFFPDARWKNLLVYFEHGNIAEPTTFQTLKESLVTKACSSIAEILKRTADQNRLRIRYVCALDDSFCCPDSGIVFPPEKGILEGPYEPDQLPAQLVNPTNGQLVWLLDRARPERA